jgi:membrane AbrB-like protein
MIAAPGRLQTALRTLLAIAISTAGGALAQSTGMPAGWLIGGMIAVAIAALLGAPVTIPSWLRDCAFVMVGLVMGGNVARESLSLIAQWPVTMLALAIELVLIVASTGWLLQKLFGVDRGTGYMSSFPGHLSFVMAISSAGVGDSRQIAIIQVARILLLTATAPFAILLLPGGEPGLVTTHAPMTMTTLLLVAAACAATGFVFTKLHVPAGFVLGAMFTATTARLTGNFEGQVPQLLVIASFVLVGAHIAMRLQGITGREIRSAAAAGLVATLVAVAITTGVVYLASLFVDMPFGQIWLGLSPGGLEGMGALGIAMGFDTAFIAAHHVARLLYLTIAIPLVVWLVRARPSGDGATAPQSAATLAADMRSRK